jgi:hypothetical protein
MSIITVCKFQNMYFRKCQTLVKDGKIVGFLMFTTTSKTPEEFKSREDTTGGGTLETTYDPNSKNIYVVGLSALPLVWYCLFVIIYKCNKNKDINYENIYS